ncbi:hypothetical protein Cal7507_3581 [Calothrix sp. PCC 7507]|nr:hypothetical protein Cal7507_3581 [Calothrix sp. PCC 7507]
MVIARQRSHDRAANVNIKIPDAIHAVTALLT